MLIDLHENGHLKMKRESQTEKGREQSKIDVR